MLIELVNEKASGLIKQMEELKLIRVLQEKENTQKIKLSDKYKGILTKEQGACLNKHIKEMRSEWSNTY